MFCLIFGCWTCSSLYAISVWIYIACASYCYNYSYYSSSPCCHDYDTTLLTTTTTTGRGHAILVLESQPFGYVNHYMICRDFDWDTSDPNRNPGFTGLVFEIPLKHQISWISAKGWNKRAFVDNAANHERILWSQAPRHLARSKGHLQQSRLGFPVDGYEFSLRLTFPFLKSLQNGTLLCECLSTGGTSATCGLRKTSRRVKGLPMPVRLNAGTNQDRSDESNVHSKGRSLDLKPLF